MAIYALPATSQGQWVVGTNVGVQGGIDQYRVGGINARGSEGGGTTLDVTQSPYFADSTGATNTVAAINQAIQDASSGDLVYLPAGNYRCDTPILAFHGEDEITIRGAGQALTIIDARSSSAMVLGSGSYFSGALQAVTGTDGNAGQWPKGATVMDVADTTDFAAGYLIKLLIGNEEDDARIEAGAVMAMSTKGYPDVRCPVVKVVSVASGQITIDPPLPCDCEFYNLRLQAMILPGYRLEKFGVEDLTISGVNASVDSGIIINYADQNWIRNVLFTDIVAYPVNIAYSYRCEIHHNTIGADGPSGSNSAGILMSTGTSMLITDNIIQNCAPFTEENFGSYNNVWAYNFCVGASTVINVNHGSHNMLNLYEGNIAQGYQCDGYYGSTSHDCFFRNWFHAQFEGGQRNGFTQNRFTRNFAHVGNVVGWDGISYPYNSYGNPNLGNGSYTGDAQASTGDFWADWGMTGVIQAAGLTSTQALITLNSAGQLYVGQGDIEFNGPSVFWNGGVNLRSQCHILDIDGNNVTFGLGSYTGGEAFPAAATAVYVWVGTNGFQERDLDCEASTISVHNYEADAAGVGGVTDSTADTLPDSLAYVSGDPDWWTDDGFPGAYPPVDPNAPNFSVSIIPAGYRYTLVPPPDPPDPAAPSVPPAVSFMARAGGLIRRG